MSKAFGIDLHRGLDAAALSFTGDLDLATRDQVVGAQILAITGLDAVFAGPRADDDSV